MSSTPSPLPPADATTTPSGLPTLAPPPPAPEVNYRLDRRRGFFRMLKAEGAIFSFIGLCLVMAQFIAASPIIVALAIFLALLPTPVLIGSILWVDRFEPEPRGVLFRTFLWGAGAATFGAIIVNTLSQVIVTAEFGKKEGELFATTISAPVVEEALKALALLWVFRKVRGVMDGVHDGIVYAAMVALGFATVENVLYYVNGVYEGGVGVMVLTFILRGIMTPFGHPIFTAFTGIGFGLAVLSKSRFLRFILPLIGLGFAVGAHHTWNASASSSQFLIVYLGYLVLIVLFGLFLMLGTRRQRKLLEEGLRGEVEAQRLTPLEYQHLCQGGLHRMRMGRRARKSGRAAKDAWYLMQVFAAELAQFRAKGHRMHSLEQATALEQDFVTGLANARMRLHQSAPHMLTSPV